MNETTKSPFFAAVADALDKAAHLRTSSDCVLMVMADGFTASHLVGGNMEVIESVLLNFMQKNPRVAQTICHAAIDYQVRYATRSIINAVEAPLPADGVAALSPWSLIPSPRYQMGVDVASTDENETRKNGGMSMNDVPQSNNSQ